MNIKEEFEKQRLYCGRMLSGGKHAPMGQRCVWNANAIIRSQGKIWYGDINLTKEGKKLKKISNIIGEPIYILREMDARFGSELNPIEVLIEKAVWSTTDSFPDMAGQV
jgi:hypothetical protein